MLLASKGFSIVYYFVESWWGHFPTRVDPFGRKRKSLDDDPQPFPTRVFFAYYREHIRAPIQEPSDKGVAFSKIILT